MPPKRGGKSASSTSNRRTDNSTPTSAGRKTSTTPRPSSAQQHPRGNTRPSPPHPRPDRDGTAQTSSQRPSSSASSRPSQRRDSTASVSSMSSRSGRGRCSDPALHGLPVYGMESSGYSRPSSAPFPFVLPGHTGSQLDRFFELLQGQAGAVGLGDGGRSRDSVKQFSASSSSSKKETGRGRPKLSSTTTATRQNENPDFHRSFQMSMPLFSHDATTPQYQEYPAFEELTGRGGVFGGESFDGRERMMRVGGFGDGGGGARAKLSASTKSMGSGVSTSRTMSCRGTRTSELDLIKEADEVMKAAEIEKSPNPTRQGNQFFDDEVKLGGDEKRHAAHEFSRLRNNLLESLDTGSEWKWEVLNSGSSYDGTKVTRPDEMDCMFFPGNISEDWMEIDFHGAPPGFCFVKLKKLSELDSKYEGLKGLCEASTMRINATKFKKMTFKLFKKGIENTRNAKAGRAGPGAAALPVEYRVIPSSAGKGLLPMSVDLVPALRFTMWPRKLTTLLKKLPPKVAEGVEEAGLHVVPKPCLDDRYEEDRDFLWRLSFSAAEKEMTKFLDGKYRNPAAGTTCRKQVLRVMKRILEICKGFKNSKTKQFCANAKELKLAVTTLQKRRKVTIKHFSTFTIRTALWDSFYVQHPDDDHWHISKKRSRLLDTLELLKKMLMGQTTVSQFFVPELDIMSSVPVEEREFLYIIFTIVEKLF